MEINKSGRLGPNEERPWNGYSFHSKGKEMTLVGFNWGSA